LHCPNCAEQIRDTAKVCGYCGTRLTAPVAAVPDLEPEVATPLDDAEPPEPEPELEPDILVFASGGGFKRLLYVVIGGAATAAVVIAALVLGGGEDRPNDTISDDTVGSVDIGGIPVLGTWRAIDEEDGSTMWLFIDESASPGRVEVAWYLIPSPVCGDSAVAVTFESGATYSEAASFLLLDGEPLACLFDNGDRSAIGTRVGGYRYVEASNRLVDPDSGSEYSSVSASRADVIQR